ncbi:MAG: hypothetical protein KC964_03525 [Candidatus Omnitrophica bacterium]|nr:hypothetical protein [Candidatus Omnitrophota bacterium]
MDSAESFEQHLQSLVGETVDQIGWAPILGSAISLYLGDRFKFIDPSPRRIPNRSEADRLYGYTYRLHLYLCAWRIQSSEEVILTWNDHRSMEPDTFRSLLKGLEGSTVRDVQFRLPTYDLRIQFSQGLELLTFCDSAGEDNDDYDFEFSVSNFLYEVGPGGRINAEVENRLDLSSPLDESIP